jgi:hypothetical protein
MGVIFDLVIADEGDAEAIGTTEHLFRDYRVFSTKMLDPVTLDELFTLIDATSPDIESWWERPLFEEEELSIFQLPPYFVEKLAGLLEHERASLAQRWSQTEEVQNFYHWFSNLAGEEVTADVGILVDKISAFAFDATERDKRVFLYTLP